MVHRAWNFQRSCSQLSRNVCVRIVAIEVFLYWWYSSKEHSFRNFLKENYIRPIWGNFHLLTSPSEVQLTWFVQGLLYMIGALIAVWGKTEPAPYFESTKKDFFGIRQIISMLLKKHNYGWFINPYITCWECHKISRRSFCQTIWKGSKTAIFVTLDHYCCYHQKHLGCMFFIMTPLHPTN